MEKKSDNLILIPLVNHYKKINANLVCAMQLKNFDILNHSCFYRRPTI